MRSQFYKISAPKKITVLHLIQILPPFSKGAQFLNGIIAVINFKSSPFYKCFLEENLEKHVARGMFFRAPGRMLGLSTHNAQFFPLFNDDICD